MTETQIENKQTPSQRWAAKHYRSWYEKNKAEILAKRRAYYEKNKELIQARTKRYYRDNKERAGEWAKDRRERNLDRIREVKRAYAKTMPSIFEISKKHARERGIEWGISFDLFAELRGRPCHYCGCALVGTSGGLDRIDNEKGYEPQNVLPACPDCNRHRGHTWTVEETKAAVQAVMALRGRR